MAPASDTSETPSVFTDDLLDREPEDFMWKRVSRDECLMDLSFWDGKVLSNVKVDSLLAQSPVFKTRAENLSKPLYEVRGSFKGWCLVLELINKTEPPKTTYTLQHIGEALEIAKYYEMHLAEASLILLAMSWIGKARVAVETLLEDASHPMKLFVTRALEWESAVSKAATGPMDFSKPPSVLVERLQKQCILKAVMEYTKLRKTQLSSILSIMSMHSIETCDYKDAYASNCYWNDASGAKNYAGRKSSKGTLVPNAASALWHDAKEQMRGYAEALDMPSSNMAMSQTEKDILARNCCENCKKEVKTLFRLTKMLAKERQLL